MRPGSADSTASFARIKKDEFRVRMARVQIVCAVAVASMALAWPSAHLAHLWSIYTPVDDKLHPGT